MTDRHPGRIHLGSNDIAKLLELRGRRPGRHPPATRPSRGARIADAVAAMVGSWRFIIAQTVVLAMWIAVNVVAYLGHWDPYPFILLNLILSFQAAYSAPIIMMSQNRQAEIDRRNAEHDYQVNVKAELEIELLHQKIDALREQEIMKLVNIIERLSAHIAPELATDPRRPGSSPPPAT